MTTPEIFATILFCDETRQENTGKQILIGEYAATCNFAKIPAIMNSLTCVVILHWFNLDHDQIVHVQVDGPVAGQQLKFDISINVEQPMTGDDMGYHFGSFSSFQVPIESTGSFVEAKVIHEESLLTRRRLIFMETPATKEN